MKMVSTLEIVFTGKVTRIHMEAEEIVIQEMYKLLQKTGFYPRFIQKKIKPVYTKELFTAKQLFCILKAKEFGYYEYPRKHSAFEIAQMVGLSQATFGEHVRKAEEIVINEYFKDVQQ